MINLPFLLRLILQIIQILLGSGLFDEKSAHSLHSLVDDVNRVKEKKQ